MRGREVDKRLTIRQVVTRLLAQLCRPGKVKVNEVLARYVESFAEWVPQLPFHWVLVWNAGGLEMKPLRPAPGFRPLMFVGVLDMCLISQTTEVLQCLLVLTSSFPSEFCQDPPLR